MARMKTLYGIIEDLEDMFPGAPIDVDLDSGNYNEIVITIKTGLVEPADGQQLHTVNEIIEIIED